jgi:hypothetical protein
MTNRPGRLTLSIMDCNALSPCHRIVDELMAATSAAMTMK